MSNIGNKVVDWSLMVMSIKKRRGDLQIPAPPQDSAHSLRTLPYRWWSHYNLRAL